MSPRIRTWFKEISRFGISRIGLMLSAAVYCAGCGVREMHVITAEDAGVIWIDGHPMGNREVSMDTPRASATSLEWYRDGKRVGGKIVELDPPLGYSFPLDYFFEALLPLPRAWHTEFRIEADPPPPPPQDHFGPTPSNPWLALLRQVRVDAEAAAIVGAALERREALRMEGRPSGTRR